MEIIGVEREIVSAPARAVVRYRASSFQADELERDAADDALVFESLSFRELFDMAEVPADRRLSFAESSRLAVYAGGWQSWSAGWELVGNERLPRRVNLFPMLLRFTNRAGDGGGPRELVGHFIMYIRAGDSYLCVASREGDGALPVTYRVNRRAERVTVEVYSRGEAWSDGDAIAELHVFFVEGFFALKDTLRTIYDPEERFSQLSFLRGDEATSSKDNLPGGYASWYNHYTEINEALILEDLESLGHTENLINLRYIRRNRPTIFQIDDGWQRAVGDWDVDESRFPNGLRSLAERIEAEGYIPGLWIAPFLVTRKSKLFSEKSEWLLKDASGELVPAGYNPNWDKTFYCLDLSRRDVLDHLRSVVARAIDEWGFRYLKLDFLYAGMLPGTFSSEESVDGRKPGGVFSNYERGVRILTERKIDSNGRRVAYLGCGVPFGPSYRHFPLSRIGADTKEDWDWPLAKFIGHVGRPSAYVSLRDTIGRSFMDGSIFMNDPDVIFLRSRNCRLSENEKELIALVNFLLASQIMFSDNPARMDAAETALTERILGLYDVLSDDEYGATRLEKDIFRLESRSGTVVGLINLRRRPFVLHRHVDADLYAVLARGRPIVDHRTRKRSPSRFAPRSITIVRV